MQPSLEIKTPKPWTIPTRKYSRTPLIRPPSESHWWGRIRGMVAREGFIYMLRCSTENHTSRHLRNTCVYCINAWQITTQFNETSFLKCYQFFFLDSVVLLVAPAIWTTCRDANILRLGFYNSLEKYKSSSLLNSVFTVAYPGGFSGCPETPPGHDFVLIYPNDTLTGTDLHQPLKFVTFGNPPWNQLWIRMLCLRNILHKTSCCTAVDNNCSTDAASSKHFN